MAVRRHGESSVIADVLTAEHGRHSGVIRGGASRKMAPILQPGAQLDLAWRARLEDHIGSFSVELKRSRSAVVMSDRLALSGLNAVTSLIQFLLPERQTQAVIYPRTIGLLDLLGNNLLWPLAYLRWEITLLEELGFGLDLTACAVTGTQENLIYVSPKTGRAVSANGAGEWADRLLPLPPVMLQKGDASDREIAQAFETTGYFLSRHVAPYLGDKPLPEARARFVSAFSRAT